MFVRYKKTEINEELKLMSNWIWRCEMNYTGSIQDTATTVKTTQ